MVFWFCWASLYDDPVVFFFWVTGNLHLEKDVNNKLSACFSELG